MCEESGDAENNKSRTLDDIIGDFEGAVSALQVIAKSRDVADNVKDTLRSCAKALSAFITTLIDGCEPDAIGELIAQRMGTLFGLLEADDDDQLGADEIITLSMTANIIERGFQALGIGRLRDLSA